MQSWLVRELDLSGAPARPVLALGVAAAMIGLVAAADYATGYEVRLAILYLLPISLTTWIAGARWGVAAALASTTAWLLAFRASHPYQLDFHYYWEGGVMSGTFLVVVALLARLRTALERSDERFVTVLEEIDVAVCVERPAPEGVIFSNRRFRDTFGRRSFPGAAGEYRDAATGRWYLAREREIRWLDGRPARLRILADITEIKHAAESLRHHRDASERSARLVALGELGSSLAHELNQPLAAIVTYLDTCALLLKAAGAGAEPLEAIAKGRGQATRAGAIVQRLREFLRQRRAPSGVSGLDEIVEQALQLVREEADELGVRLQAEFEPGLPRVAADAVLIEQVLLNLIRNGLEAMRDVPVAGRELRIVARRNGEGAVTVAVTDRGAGIDAGTAARLFDPFFTTKEEGLGLGLGICRSVIEAHGGRLWHEPAPGGGTMFQFSLPERRA